MSPTSTHVSATKSKLPSTKTGCVKTILSRDRSWHNLLALIMSGVTDQSLQHALTSLDSVDGLLRPKSKLYAAIAEKMSLAELQGFLLLFQSALRKDAVFLEVPMAAALSEAFARPDRAPSGRITAADYDAALRIFEEHERAYELRASVADPVYHGWLTRARSQLDWSDTHDLPRVRPDPIACPESWNSYKRVRRLMGA